VTKASTGRIQFLAEDFRNVSGRFDVFVSVGMLEHVGLANYRDLGRVIHERLDPRHGRGLLHFIGPQPPARGRPLDAQAHLPGLVLPDAVGGLLARARAVGLLGARRREPAPALRAHARGVAAPLRAGRAARGALFDERFIRSWRLYLASSQAAFAAGSLQLFQAVFARGCEDDVPWTRRTSTARPTPAGRGLGRCDALVVGGGPAGSTCAAWLRQAGLDVLVMDRARFPRDKPCAGWITPQAVAAAELDLDEYGRARVLQPIRGLQTAR
jgi:hypothetical protein